MDILRQELIETQKARSELIKWKLLLVSALGAVGLGFAKNEGKSVTNAEALLCCIPFVCAYVDAQYVNLGLRIMGIATFLREVGPKVGVLSSLTEYERFMAFSTKSIRDTYPRLGLHSFQSWVVRASSILLSGLVGFYPLISLALRRPRLSAWVMLAMLLTGMGGIALDLWLFHQANVRRKIIQEAGKEFTATPSKEIA